MKKMILSAAMLVFSAGISGAQNMYDAITFSQSNNVGTARTLGMGNAVTAVGGDLGTIGINPAGAAVARYGQLTITPGLSISAVGSSYSNEGDKAFGPVTSVRSSKLGLPNFGLSMVSKTGNRTGVKRYTFAIVSNRTDNYLYQANAYGSNSRTSKIAELADAAWGIKESVLADYSSFSNSDVSWDILSGYQGGLFGTFGYDGEYAGVTEAISADGTYHYVPGNLSQSSYVVRSGNKNDLVFNFAVDIDDNLFIGANIGLPSAYYDYMESFCETPLNAEEFPISFMSGHANVDTYFRSGTYDYQYIADVRGIYVKAGVIYMPTRKLRIGAAIQSPVSYTISETWQYSTSSSFDNSAFNGSSSSPVGEYTYRLLSPYVADFGVAYTLNKSAILSVDYELVDYSTMRFREIGAADYVFGSNADPFKDINMANKNFAGIAHKIRVGAEVRLNPMLSVRAGYNFATSPEKHWTNSENVDVTASDYLSDFGLYDSHVKNLVSARYYDDVTRSVSFGLGYSSSGSFFADFAVRRTSYPATTFSPYYDYTSFDKNGAAADVISPRISNSIRFWDALVTLGWRF